MKRFDETITVEKDGKKYTNNLTNCRITCDEEVLTNYCILAVEGVTVTIKEGTMVTQVGLNDLAIKEVVKLFVNPPKKETTKKDKTSRKEETKKREGK